MSFILYPFFLETAGGWGEEVLWTEPNSCWTCKKKTGLTSHSDKKSRRKAETWQGSWQGVGTQRVGSANKGRLQVEPSISSPHPFWRAEGKEGEFCLLMMDFRKCYYGWFLRKQCKASSILMLGSPNFQRNGGQELTLPFQPPRLCL